MNQHGDFTWRTSRGTGAGRPTMERVRQYLTTRSTETWAFFVAGAVLGAIFF